MWRLFTVFCVPVAAFFADIDSRMAIGWEIFANDTIQVTVKVGGKQCMLDGWCGFGLSDTMTNTDMWIVIQQSGKIALWDMWSVEDDTPTNDLDINGCEMNLVLESSNYTAGVMYAVFNRLLDTSDTNCDQVIELDTPMGISYGYLNQENFDEHSVYGTGTAVFGSKNNSSLVTSASSGDYQTHGILMGVAWVGCAPICAMLARYGKKYWMWFYLHALGGYYALIATYYTASDLYKKNADGSTSLTGDLSYHFRLGMTVSSLVFSTVILGLTTKLWVRSSTLRIDPLRYFRSLHKIVAYTTIVIGMITCYYGLYLYKKDSLWMLYAAFSVIVAAFILGEGSLRFHWLIKLLRKKGPPKSLRYEDYAYRETEVCFLDEWVLDGASFASSHPGGSVIIRKTYTQDIGKFVVGNIGFSQECPGYIHSSYAKRLAKQLRIGKMQFQEGIIIGKVGPPFLKRMLWKIIAKEEEAGGQIVRFSLQSEDHKAVSFCPGVEWIGKHFRVTAIVNGKKIHRYYSLVLCLNYKTKGRWVNSAQRLKHQVKSISVPDRAYDNPQYDFIDLVIKHYPTGILSHHIHTLPLNSPLALKGPIGPGLRLTKSATGRHIAYAAGTGLLPFLDLVHLLWWKEVGEGEYILDPASLEGFELVLFVFARTREEVIAVELMEATHLQCAGKSNPRFRLILSIDQSREERAAIVRSGVAEAFQLVWICGPTGFNGWTEEVLKGVGVDEKLVFPF